MVSARSSRGRPIAHAAVTTSPAVCTIRGLTSRSVTTRHIPRHSSSTHLAAAADFSADSSMIFAVAAAWTAPAALDVASNR